MESRPISGQNRPPLALSATLTAVVAQSIDGHDRYDTAVPNNYQAIPQTDAMPLATPADAAFRRKMTFVGSAACCIITSALDIGACYGSYTLSLGTSAASTLAECQTGSLLGAICFVPAATSAGAQLAGGIRSSEGQYLPACLPYPSATQDSRYEIEERAFDAAQKGLVASSSVAATNILCTMLCCPGALLPNLPIIGFISVMAGLGTVAKQYGIEISGGLECVTN